MLLSSPSHNIQRSALALIAGPTASGKSAFAIALAQAERGVIINADASQVYADLAILSARPGPAETAQAPHRLFGYRDGAEACSAARWSADAQAEINAAHEAGLLPILVGGTGLYFDTLLHGIAPVPDIAPDIRTAVRAMPVTQSHAALSREDPAAARRLHPGDTTRVARALEVVRSTGRTLSDWQQTRSGGILPHYTIHAAIIDRPRDDLAQRARSRLDAMMQGGAIEEVAKLLSRGLHPDLPVMRALGVREIAQALNGAIDENEAQNRILAATIAYQKRQRTWAKSRQKNWARLQPHDDASLASMAILPCD